MGARRLTLSTINILMEAMPSGVDLVEVRGAFLTASRVASVHDLHVWTLTSICIAVSAHLRLTDAVLPVDSSSLLVGLRYTLKRQYDIDHLTLQIEGANFPDEEIHCIGDPRCLA